MAEAFPNVEAWLFLLDDIAWPAILQPLEAAHAARIPGATQRLRYERGRSALRRVLSHRTKSPPQDIAFEIAPGGKPRVAGCEFSISHSGPWLAVIISDTPVGVDIETHRPGRNIMDIARRFFSTPDIQSLEATGEALRERAFFRQWVAKEAALKAAGTGLSNHLHQAVCWFQDGAVVRVQRDALEFAIHEFELPDGTPGAVARAGRGKICIEWRDPSEINVS